MSLTMKNGLRGVGWGGGGGGGGGGWEYLKAKSFLKPK